MNLARRVASLEAERGPACAYCGEPFPRCTAAQVEAEVQRIQNLPPDERAAEIAQLEANVAGFEDERRRGLTELCGHCGRRQPR